MIFSGINKMGHGIGFQGTGLYRQEELVKLPLKGPNWAFHFFGEASPFFPGILLFRKPSTIPGWKRRSAFEKNDG